MKWYAVHQQEKNVDKHTRTVSWKRLLQSNYRKLFWLNIVFKREVFGP